MEFFKNKKRKHLEEEIDELYDTDEGSDLPVHEKLVKQKKIRKINRI